MCSLPQRLAKKLREARGEASQLRFSEKLGISHTSLNRMEMGQQNVTLATLELLCQRLKCDVGDLFPESDPRGSRRR